MAALSEETKEKKTCPHACYVTNQEGEKKESEFDEIISQHEGNGRKKSFPSILSPRHQLIGVEEFKRMVKSIRLVSTLAGYQLSCFLVFFFRFFPSVAIANRKYSVGSEGKHID